MDLSKSRRTWLPAASDSQCYLSARSAPAGPNRPVPRADRVQHQVGDPVAGQAVFRYETFGNQGFWTDAMQLPQGIAAAKLTPLQALQVGLNVNVSNLNAATVAALGMALQQVQSGMSPASTAFGDPNVTLSLIGQQAVMGVVVFDPTGPHLPSRMDLGHLLTSI